MSWLFTSGDQNIEASITASVFPINIQSQFPLGLTGLISLLSKGLLGVFSSISSLVLSLLHGPNLWSIYVYWKDNTFGCMELCQQSDVFAFKYTVYVCHSFPAKKQSSSNFMAAITIHSDFRDQEEESCHCFHLSPFYLPWSYGTRWHDLSYFNIQF